MGEDERVNIGNLSASLKGLLVFLSIVAIIVPCVLGFVNFDKRLDITEEVQEKHIANDEKKFDKVIADIDENEDAIHALELVDRGLTIQYQEIITTLGEMKADIKNLVRAE